MSDPIHDIFVRVQEINTIQPPNVPNVQVDIPVIEIRGSFNGEIQVQRNEAPIVNNVTVPVVTELGKPIVNIPGCVEAHKDNTGKNENLVDDDPKGVQTFCDAGTPSFNPIDYVSDELEFQQEEYKPDFKIEPPPMPPPPEVPETPCVKPKVRDPITNQCVEPVKPPTEQVIEQPAEPIVISEYIPELSVVTTTAAIATTAAASALLAKPLADALMKVFKPLAKKGVAKVNAILGRTPPHINRWEIKANEYREKKGLPPLKKQKKKKKD